MNDNVKLKLIKLIEPQVIASLIAHNYVTQIENSLSWDSIIINDYTTQLIYELDNEDDSFIEEFRELFPPQWRDPVKYLKKRYYQWKKKTTLDISEEEILEIARHYIENTNEQYVGRAGYFFYKYDSGNYFSRLENKYNEINEGALQAQYRFSQ
jgi:hypothetical protein